MNKRLLTILIALTLHRSCLYASQLGDPTQVAPVNHDLTLVRKVLIQHDNIYTLASLAWAHDTEALNILTSIYPEIYAAAQQAIQYLDHVINYIPSHDQRTQKQMIRLIASLNNPQTQACNPEHLINMLQTFRDTQLIHQGMRLFHQKKAQPVRLVLPEGSDSDGDELDASFVNKAKLIEAIRTMSPEAHEDGELALAIALSMEKP